MANRLLRLRAEDAEDLAIISAALQDAAFVMRDLNYDSKARHFIAEANRFRWEAAKGRGPYSRIRSALSVSDVTGVRSRKVRLGEPDAAGVLLSVTFQPTDADPGGVLVLSLGGGGEIRLNVDCIDVSLTDAGAPWSTPNRPDHESV